MGVNIESLDPENAALYRTNIRKIGDSAQYRMFAPLLHYDLTYWLSGRMKALSKLTRQVSSFTGKIIQERRLISNRNGCIQKLEVDNDNVLVNIKIKNFKRIFNSFSLQLSK